jgi:hypothetical protein
MRGSDQASPQEIFDQFTKEMEEEKIKDLTDPDTGESLGLKTYQDIINYMMKIGALIPYKGVTSDSAPIALFTSPDYEESFKQKWNMYSIPLSNYNELSELSSVINSLHRKH